MNINKLFNDDAFCNDCKLFSNGHCMSVEDTCSMYDTFSELRESYMTLRSVVIKEEK